jgi:hypothetical protein
MLTGIYTKKRGEDFRQHDQMSEIFSIPYALYLLTECCRERFSNSRVLMSPFNFVIESNIFNSIMKELIIKK